jgi:subtilisin family serine protease
MHRRHSQLINLAFTLTLGFLLTPVAWAGEIHPNVTQAALDAGPDGTVSVLIRLTDQAPIARLNQELKARRATRAERHREVIEALQAAAQRSQGPILQLLQQGKGDGRVVGFTPYWISNVIVAQVRPAFFDELEARTDIEVVELNFTPDLIRPVAEKRWMGERGEYEGEVIIQGRDFETTPGLKAINADRCWYELGITGAGRLVCGQDTGVDATHPALEARWRGYNGEHPPEECWLDVLADSIGIPYDHDAHGTHTMGTMCALGEETGDTVGVAWGAKWIACNSIGQGGSSEEFDNDILACFEWIADPDGDPGTVDDVPDVVQNSWGVRELPPEGSYYKRCEDRYWDVIDNCEAAGVVVTFSAGNEGPFGMSLRIPPDRASTPYNTFAVGAIDATNFPFPYPIAVFSSRGPSSCDETSIKPEVSAPGVDVISTVPGGDYAPNSGTSMAGPHVAGVVALMREVDPDLEVDRIKQILMDTAVDHGDPGEENVYGHGVIDAYAACLAVMNGYGNLSGMVRDAGTLDPLEGATVHVPEMERVAMTDASGAYDLKHLPAGTYDVVTSLFGYDPDTSSVQVEEDGRAVHNVSLNSQPRGTLLVTVTDGADPIAGVVAELLDAPVAKVLTDAAGDALFPDLPERSYSLATGLFGWHPQVTSVDVTEDDTTAVPLTFVPGVLEDFEIDQGWIVGAPGDSAYEGIWERADPNFVMIADELIQPADDVTLDGVNCYITHNGPENGWRFFGDVDGGHTTLLSPVFDATVSETPALTYYLWFHNQSGFPQDQQFRADISDDGGESWQNVQTLDFGDGGWEHQVIVLGVDAPAPTEQMQIRFIAEDISGTTAVVEAAVDEIRLYPDASAVGETWGPTTLTLSAPRPNPLSGGAVLKFSLPRAQEVSLSIYDASGRRVRSLFSGEKEAGVHRILWDGAGDSGRRVSSGIYFLRLSTEGKDLSKKLVVTK